MKLMKSGVAVLFAGGLFLGLGGTAFAAPDQPPPGHGDPIATIKNSNPDEMGRYQDLCGNTAVSAWAGDQSGGHANVGNPENPNGHQPGGGC